MSKVQFRRSIAALLQYGLKAAPLLFAAYLISSLLCGGVMALWQWILAKKLVDTLSSGQMGVIVPVIVLLGLVFLLMHCLTLFTSFIEGVLRTRVTRFCEQALLLKGRQLPLEEYYSAELHNSLERARTAISRLTAVMQQATYLLRGSASLVTTSVILAVLDWRTLPWIIGITVGTSYLTVRQGLQSYFLAYQQTALEREKEYYEKVMGTREFADEIRVYDLGGFLLNRWRQLAERAYCERLRLIVRHTLAQVLTSFRFIILIIPLYITLRYPLNSLTTGDMVFVVTAAVGGLQQFSNWGINLSQFVKNLAFVQDLRSFLEGGSETSSECSSALVPQDSWCLEVENLTYCYPGQSQPALKGINLTISAGETVAIVGPNGSGKSTLISLLLGMLTPTQGSVRLCSSDSAVNTCSVSRPFGEVVFQDFNRYEASLRDNVRFGNLSVNDSSIIRALERAGVAGLIYEFTSGLSTWLGREYHSNGVEISGGQWQRVAIARANVVEHPLLRVYDEPTASIDPVHELNLMNLFLEGGGDSATIIVCHRLGITRFVDRVVVLQNGQVVEDGSPAELLAKNGVYARLYHRQAELYR